jgi:tellurite resistance protein TerC
MEGWIFWAIFGAIVLGGMALDLGVFHKKDKVVSVKEALLFTGLWIAVAMAFLAGIYYFIDPHHANDATRPSIEFLTCYITEYALSVDNIFVFIVIFRFFAIPAESQHRVLLWGVLGAMVMRGLFLFIGIEAIERFHWVLYGLGALLIYTGIRLFFQGDDDEVDPGKNFVLRFARRHFPVTPTFVGSKFFVVENSKRLVTPLFLALLVVETTDILFAVDSVPASLGISQDMFVVYTSNIFAILGLRSLFFAVGGLIRYLRYLKHGLSAVLVFIGGKMLLPEEHKIPITWALGVVAGILTVAIVASLVREKLDRNEPRN